jgi:hypothetical protein
MEDSSPIFKMPSFLSPKENATGALAAENAGQSIPILHLSNVPLSYILGEECSSEVHVLSFVAYKLRHVVQSYIPFLKCTYQVHLTRIVAVTVMLWSSQLHLSSLSL